MLQLRRQPAGWRNVETLFTLAYDHTSHSYVLVRRSDGVAEQEIIDDETAEFIIRQIQERGPDRATSSARNLVDQRTPLHPREVMVLQAVADGLTNRAIAHRLHITENTTKRHLQSIFIKLGVKSRTQAAMLALSKGWILQDELTTTERR